MLTKISSLRSMYVFLCAYNRVTQSRANGPLLVYRIFVTSPQSTVRGLSQDLNHLLCWFLVARQFFWEEAPHRFAFWCHPLVPSHCFVHLKYSYSVLKTNYLHSFPRGLYKHMVPPCNSSLPLDLKQPPECK